MTLALSLAAVGLLMWTACTASADSTSVRCRISPLRPLVHNRSFNFGNSRIAVALPRRATFVAVPESQPGRAFLRKDGSIQAKVGWWTKSETRPHATGRRIDRRARPLRVDMGTRSWRAGGGGATFFPSSLVFPSVGCWRITATTERARLVAVVKVVRQ